MPRHVRLILLGMLLITLAGCSGGKRPANPPMPLPGAVGTTTGDTSLPGPATAQSTPSPGAALLREAQQKTAKGDLKGAQEALRQAVARDPNSGPVHAALSRAYLAGAGHEEQALPEAEAALRPAQAPQHKPQSPLVAQTAPRRLHYE